MKDPAALSPGIKPIVSILRCVIPVVCVTNERDESVVNEHTTSTRPHTDIQTLLNRCRNLAMAIIGRNM